MIQNGQLLITTKQSNLILRTKNSIGGIERRPSTTHASFTHRPIRNSRRSSASWSMINVRGGLFDIDQLPSGREAQSFKDSTNDKACSEGPYAPPRVHHASRRRGCGLAICRACAASPDGPEGRIPLSRSRNL